MDPADERPRPASSFARGLVLVLFLPLALLAWPFAGAPLADDPYPHLSGAGLVALALLPAALAIVLWRVPLGGKGLLGLVLLFGLVAGEALLRATVDPFEARRAVVHASLAVVGFAGGRALAARGRRDLLRGLALVSLVWTAGALARSFLAGAGHLAGVLGNSGLLSQAALAGAVAGACLALAGRAAERVLGLAAYLSFVAHAGLAPVWAGALALGLALALAAFLERAFDRRRSLLVAAALAFALVPLVRFTVGARPGVAPGVPAGAAAPSADVGGVAVRLLTWRAIQAVVLAHPLGGLGPGQFRARFPAFRLARETVLSRHGDCSRAGTEVEHAHQDLLEALAELGIPGGLFAALLGAGALLAALRALRSGDATLAAAGAALVALLANACLHAPFFANPSAALIGALLAGTVARGTREPARARVGAAGALGLLVIALGSAWLGWPLVRHGRALVAYVHAAARIVALQAKPADRPLLVGELQSAAADARRALAEALAAAPDSPYARLLAAHSATPDQALERWNAVLELRPESSEALEGLGLAHARAGEVELARAAWERALALSAGQARIQENLARLELVDGEPARGFELVESLRARGCLDPGWSRKLGIELVLRGKPEAGARLFLGRELATLVPEQLFADAGRTPQDPAERDLPQRAEALKALAQILWAREHVAERDFDAALRSYRQAFLASRLVLPQGAPPLAAELAAVECLAGRPEEARRALAPFADALRLGELPAWARTALVEAGLLEAAPGAR